MELESSRGSVGGSRAARPSAAAGTEYTPRKREAAALSAGSPDTPVGAPCESSRSAQRVPHPLISAARASASTFASLPWIRRLAADYARPFEALAPFYRGQSRRRGAWRDSIARTKPTLAIARAGGPDRDEQCRRNAPPAARDACARLLDPRTVAVVTGSRRACSAVRSSRCSRPSPRSGSPPRSSAARPAGGGGLLDRCRGPRLGRGRVRRPARRGVRTRTLTLPAARGRGNHVPVATIALGRRRSSSCCRDARGGVAGHGVHRRAARSAARGVPARAWHGRGLRPLARRRARAARGWCSTTVPTPPPSPLRRGSSRDELTTRANVAAGVRGGRRPRATGLPRAGHAPPRRGRAVLPRRGATGHPIARDGSDFVGGRDGLRPRDWPTRRSSNPSTSAPTCCCDRSSRTRSSPPSPTWPGRASSPIWASCKRCLRALRDSRCRSSCRAPRPRCSIRRAARFLSRYHLSMHAAAGAGRERR